MNKVFITGMGAISSLGTTVSENHSSLKNGITGIGKARFFKSRYADILPFAEISLSDEALKSKLNCTESGITRTTLIAFHAFDEAIKDAQLTPEDIGDFRTAFISSSTVGGMCYTDELFADANLREDVSEYVRAYEGSEHTLQIAKKYSIKGITDTINTACSSSANAIMLGARLIQTNRADRVIVGGADCLAKYTVNGFNSLSILSEHTSKPFDEERDGLTLGEAAAYLVLESDKVIGAKKKHAELTGFGNANDAFHPSATSDDAIGPLKAMNEALKTANLAPSAIDYINAHGTGTPNNDQTETFAFSQLFENVPPFNSTKSYTGHTLAAAGVIEGIFSILSIQHSEIYASLNISTPISIVNISANTEYLANRSINHVLSNSFGFGGNCTSLIFSKCS